MSKIKMDGRERLNINVSDVLEDYMVTIYRLEEVFGAAKTTCIAKELNVKPATVTKVVKRLEDKGLVKRIKYYSIILTDEGRRIAESIIRRHRILEAFLKDYLGFNNYESHSLAHKLEHMPSILIERIYERLGKPSLCPHGNPIPGAKANILECISLNDAEENKSYVIVRVAGELRSTIKTLKTYNLDVGSKVKVLEKSKYYTLIRLEDGSIARLDSMVAKTLGVRRA